jgi:carboxyl-terminal processing protease
MSNNKFSVFIPLFIGLALAVGVAIGYFFSGNNGAKKITGIKNTSTNKLNDVLSYIIEEYVDTVNVKNLEDDAVVSLLEQLDPHSSYIPATELQAVSEQLEGNFDGIGVEFNIQKDTIMVVAAISGGPSESLGIQSGDRIVRVEKKNVAGTGIKNDDVIKLLRGKSGSKVKVGIIRPGVKSITQYEITRGKIPIYSVDASIMLDATTGYIKISRFGATTYDEYMKAFNDLKIKGMSKLVLDLRDNPGGYLNAAVDICDEFLSKGNKIVYTQGKARKREDFDATAKGGFENGGLVVLIDEGSASASEIVSGAVQDNDRGWIIGRRSFGKGLVQEEVRFDDGSAMRLTIARYYTPSGRSIQKPYDKGNDAYYQELSERYQKPDSSKQVNIKETKSVAFKTPSGRKVYGGGGITPDIIIAVDTSGYTPLLAEIASKGLMNRFAFEYTDGKRDAIKKQFKNEEQFASNFNSASLLQEFNLFIQKNGIKPNDAALRISSQIIERQTKALIARAVFGNAGFYIVLNKYDLGVKKAIEILKSNKLVTANGSPKNQDAF